MTKSLYMHKDETQIIL